MRYMILAFALLASPAFAQQAATPPAEKKVTLSVTLPQYDFLANALARSYCGNPSSLIVNPNERQMCEQASALFATMQGQVTEQLRAKP